MNSLENPNLDGDFKALLKIQEVSSKYFKSKMILIYIMQDSGDIT